LDEFMQDLKKRDAEKKEREVNASQSAEEEGELCPICYADVRASGAILHIFASGDVLSSHSPSFSCVGHQHHVPAVQASVVQEVHPETHAAEQDLFLLQGRDRFAR
jgi:hypothetical protein